MYEFILINMSVFNYINLALNYNLCIFLVQAVVNAFSWIHTAVLALLKCWMFLALPDDLLSNIQLLWLWLSVSCPELMVN